MPESTSHAAGWRIVGALCFLAALPFACAYAVGAVDPAFADGDPGQLRWINALPVGLAVLLLWSVTGRALLSGWFAFWLLWGLHFVNAAKVEQLRRMLTPGDWRLLGQVFGNLDLFASYVVPTLGGALAALAVLAVAGMLARFEPRTLPRPALRVPLAVITGSLAASLVQGHTAWRSVLHDQALGGFQIWAPDHSMQRSGLAIGLLRLGWEDSAVVVPVHPADAQVLDGFAAATAGIASGPFGSADGAPDIVVVQSEALFDPARLRGVGHREWLAEFRALAATGLHGNLRVPAYGGGTIRTEFEVLTAYPLRAFPGVSYPYYGLTDRSIEALPARLGALGYRRLVVHPYERSFWNRDAALTRLGFDEAQYDTDSAFRDPHRHGPFVSDEAAYSATLALLEDDRPQFVFVITMENHSPWRHRANFDKSARDAIAVPRGLEEDARKSLQTYLLHLESGDRALGTFARALLARPRPTLLLVYGDHLPALTPVFDQLGFDDGRGALEQPVPYLITGNLPLPRGRRDLEAHQLAPLLMQLADLPLDGYFGLSAALRERAGTCRTADECGRIDSLAVAAAIRDYRR